MANIIRQPRTYVEKRDALINTAVMIANKKHPDSDDKKYNESWNRTFHKEMNRLAYEAGLVGFP
jgi:hypothetical protein